MIRAREIREKQNLTQYSLAKMIGICQGSLSDIESGKKNPSLEVLIRLALALNCSLDELVDLSRYPSAS